MSVGVGNPPPQTGDHGGFGRFEDDRGLLVAFVRNVKGLLEAIVEARLVGDTVSGLQAEAWFAVRNRFRPVIDILQTGDIDDELVRRGLTGSELRFKIGVVDRGLARVREGTAFLIERLHALPASVVGSILEAIDPILGSLDFIPGAEAIAEFKDSTKAAVGLETAGRSERS